MATSIRYGTAATKDGVYDTYAEFLDSGGAQANPGPVVIGGELQIIGGALAPFDSPVYNPDGTLASVSINGVTYTFAYIGGKLSTAVGGGVTKTYTWSGDQLQSIEVS